MEVLAYVLLVLHSLGITLSDVQLKMWPTDRVPESSCVAFTGAEGHVIACPSSRILYIVPVRPST